MALRWLLGWMHTQLAKCWTRGMEQAGTPVSFRRGL